MNKMIRGFGLLAAAGAFFTAGLSGCSSQGGESTSEVGSISLPLAANAPSGVRYQLRNATFDIRNRDYYYGGVGGSGGGYNYGGWDGGQEVVTVNSEDHDPNASAILVDLERGRYQVTLRPGWSFQKVEEDGTKTNVEATLLSASTVYIRVSPHSTSWAQYNFGIGDSSLWLNGKVNLDINVYDDPDQYYGYGGYGGEGGGGGVGGSGGFTSTGVGGAGGAGGAAGVGGSDW
ncbi:hypothetical protein SOCE26_065190 [Sorangium cellulosum]|uniref:Secreted protein n=1 Tax=Sorangium cellulosum TaxID=56 RepID=A0A2L0F0E4_SORCE|nr:hypothetical protein [Sorangium cellulosum]AUX45038.1 hypothetical protein SOCE26_065190 [Sorangium cellulosum]